MATQPVELILARALMQNLTTPAVLVDVNGALVFFNEAAGELLGLRYEEAGPLRVRDWATRFSPVTEDGRPFEVGELPLAVALREGRPVHMRFIVHTPRGDERVIEDSAFPIVGNGGLQGAMAIFWDAASS